MKRTTNTILALAASSLLFPSAATAGYGYVWGSAPDESMQSGWRINAGPIFSLSGNVDETFRAYYKASGQNEKQALAESYSLDDFNVQTPYFTLGFQYDKQWKWWAFKWETLFFDLSADAVAKRDYYIGVNKDIDFNGKSYDHMMIPKGSKMSLDAFCVMSDAMFSFTPFTYYFSDTVRFTPSLDLGLVLIGGRYGIDAGEPRGSTVYQNPPVDFVICGDSSGFVGAGAPKFGLGATLTVGSDGNTQWITKGNIGYFAYDGSSSPFTSADHREKDLDLTFLSIGLESGFLFPFESGSALTVGLRLEFMSLDGDIRSKYTDAADIISARERFDKSIDFKMATAMAYIGFRF